MMNRRAFLGTAAAALVTARRQTAARRNVVLILADALIARCLLHDTPAAG